MRNVPFLLWVLLLVDGVSNNEKEAKEGESVTLNHGEIVGDDTMQWWFGGEMIARFNIKNINKTYPGPNNIFSNRLKLDHQTGFLTIKNIRHEHGGVYTLKIKSTEEKSVNFNVIVSVYKGVTSMSRMEGDSFSLDIDVTEQKVDKIQWKFEDQVIPTDDLNPNEKWRNIDLNKETGKLFIEHIRRDQSGVYKAEINTGSSIVLGEFHVTVEIIQTMSVMEGDSVTLNTDSEMQRDDLMILWMFGDNSTRIAEINREANKTLYEDVLNERFRGRLQLDQTGSLTIKNTKTTDEGLYTVRMSRSNRETKNKRFVVIVKVSDSRNSGAGISGASVALMVWSVTVFLLQEV